MTAVQAEKEVQKAHEQCGQSCVREAGTLSAMPGAHQSLYAAVACPRDTHSNLESNSTFTTFVFYSQQKQLQQQQTTINTATALTATYSRQCN